ncbi:FAD-binding protein, partial [Leucobacter sp. M11]|uniref:FAD-binding protein n=1 Tax=Leucobacter sp. M11 TaxID=2993565 RepID=UPI002D7EC56C
FMPARHPLGELAPRDEVARGIAAQMAAQGGAPVRLDATRVPDLARRFPGITALCAAAGLDWTREPVPVAPAAHSLMGGIRTDRHGRSSLPGLYAAGESACSGVHGANRLASNSLLEGLVFGQRAALAALRDRAGGVDPDTTPVPQADEAIPSRELLLRPAAATPETASALPDRDELRALAWAELGLSRSEAGLRAAGQRFDAWAAAGDALPADAAVAERETANLALLGSLLAAAALRRAESRGAHARLDAPKPRAEWVLRQVFRAE